MRLIKLPALALAVAAGGACGTDKAIGPGGIGPKTTVNINFCALAVPSWLAAQNTGGAWTRLSPNAQGDLTFEATEKVSLAVVLDFFGSTITQVLNVSAAEIQGASLIPCEGGVGSNRVINVLVGGTPSDGATITTATLVDFETALRADRATLRGRPALRTFGAPTQFRGASWRRASTRSSNS